MDIIIFPKNLPAKFCKIMMGWEQIQQSDKSFTWYNNKEKLRISDHWNCRKGLETDQPLDNNLEYTMCKKKGIKWVVIQSLPKRCKAKKVFTSNSVMCGNGKIRHYFYFVNRPERNETDESLSGSVIADGNTIVATNGEIE